MWLYKKTGRDRWQVGFFDPGGEWIAESDQTDKDRAALRVSWLNGVAFDDEETEKLDYLRYCEAMIDRYMSWGNVAAEHGEVEKSEIHFLRAQQWADRFSDSLKKNVLGFALPEKIDIPFFRKDRRLTCDRVFRFRGRPIPIRSMLRNPKRPGDGWAVYVQYRRFHIRESDRSYAEDLAFGRWLLESENEMKAEK